MCVRIPDVSEQDTRSDNASLPNTFFILGSMTSLYASRQKRKYLCTVIVREYLANALKSAVGNTGIHRDRTIRPRTIRPNWSPEG